jgi:hypothetical protein
MNTAGFTGTEKGNKKLGDRVQMKMKGTTNLLLDVYPAEQTQFAQRARIRVQSSTKPRLSMTIHQAIRTNVRPLPWLR